MRLSFTASVVAGLVAVGVAALTGPAPASAQSLLSTRGLGVVVDPVDARASGLGGVMLGLSGSQFSWANPAEAVGVPAPGLKLAFQYDGFTSTFAGQEVDGSTARFPLVQGAFPIGERLALSLGFGGFLDQNWAIERRDTLLIGTDSVAVLDRFTSEGGVARVRLGAGYRVLDGLSVGLGVDVYTGGVQRSFGRRFPNDVQPGCCTSAWNYHGLGVLAGADWQPSEAVRLSAAASIGGTLDAEADDSVSVDASFDLPATFMAGGSARVANNLLVAASADWSGWSSLDGALADVGGARDSWSARGGVEWDGISLGERLLPIRLGARQESLPFRWGSAASETDWATERALTAGAGLLLAGGAARTDFGVERGSRGGDAAGIDESFWRITFSILVIGR